MAVDRISEQSSGIDIKPQSTGAILPPIPFRQRKDEDPWVALPGVVRKVNGRYEDFMVPQTEATYLTKIREELLALQPADSSTNQYYK